MNVSDPGPSGGVPSLEDLNAFERARQLLSAVVAAYSARIGVAGVAEAAALRSLRAPLLAEQRTLDPRDRMRVDEIVTKFPALLAQVREGER
ncbi:hypothetical protein [Streptomyces sp. NPDC001621]|uniref:hypothetical protein n=1 Tax=Streptomyces sp. NPDC001621 TaxID=3364594 RepID=UPI0036A1436C